MDENEERLGAPGPDVKPDLPEADDEAAPTRGRKLVMSRELRGWIAGLSALAVATAALAPHVDIDELRGAASLAELGEKTGELTCDASDQTKGFGGQSVGCTFTCPERPGHVKVFVDADDPDAQVSGDASCGSDNAHCSGHNNCENTEPRTESGVGNCSADSDEAVDSGLYVECTADETETLEPSDPVGSDECLLSRPFPVCTQPVCAMFDIKQQPACRKVWDTMIQTLTPTTNMVAFITGEDGAGLGCEGFVCVPFEPICVSTKDGWQSCFAP